MENRLKDFRYICSKPIPMEERQLLGALKRGDKQAFDAIFKQYASKLYYFSFELTRSEAEAEEIVQETFLKIWENRKAIDPERHFNSYLITIAKNKIYNSFRRKVVERKYWQANGIPAEVSSDVNAEQELYLEDLRRLLLEGIERLSPQQQEILVLKSRGFNNGEIAEKLGVNKKTVENHVFKAYRQLRNDLSEYREVLPFLPLLIFYSI